MTSKRLHDPDPQSAPKPKSLVFGQRNDKTVVIHKPGSKDSNSVDGPQMTQKQNPNAIKNAKGQKEE